MYASCTALLSGRLPAHRAAGFGAVRTQRAPATHCRSPRARAKSRCPDSRTGRRRRAHGRRAPPLAIQRLQVPDRFSRSTRVRAHGHRRGDDATPPPMAPQPRAGMSAVRQTRRSRPVTRPVARHQQRRQTPRYASWTRRLDIDVAIWSAKVTACYARSTFPPTTALVLEIEPRGRRQRRWAGHRPTARRSSCFERQAAAEKVRGKRTVGGSPVLGACCRPAGPTALRRMFRRAAPGPIHPSPRIAHWT